MLSRDKIPGFLDVAAQRVRKSGFARIKRFLKWPLDESTFREGMQERGIAVRASSRHNDEFDVYDCAVIR